jgi:hypothetical protein
MSETEPIPSHHSKSIDEAGSTGRKRVIVFLRRSVQEIGSILLEVLAAWYEWSIEAYVQAKSATLLPAIQWGSGWHWEGDWWVEGVEPSGDQEQSRETDQSV